MGDVFVPIFFPRWRVWFVFPARRGTFLAFGLWHRTQDDVEQHALGLLEGKLGGVGLLYDIECQGAGEESVR